jgi:hypothetical protein
MLEDINVVIKDQVLQGGPITAYDTAYDIGSPAVATIQIISTGGYRTIQIAFPTDVTFDINETIEIEGVRLDVQGFAVDGLVKMDITNSIGQAVVTNALGIEVGILKEALEMGPTVGSISFLADTGVLSNVATVTVDELFPNAFETRPDNTEIWFQLSNIPQGVRLNGYCQFDPSYSSATVDAGSCSVLTSSNAVILRIYNQDPTLWERIALGIGFELYDTPSFQPSPADVDATLFPPPGYYDNNWPYTSYLRFDVVFTGNPASISFGVVDLTSNLLAVYNAAYKDQAMPEFYSLNTGVAIINQSGSSRYGIGQFGAITVEMYPMDGSGPYTFTTSSIAKPGLGLDANGELPPRATWAVLVSELLMYATNASEDLIPGGEFQGFIYFECNFQKAEGVNYIADGSFAVQAQGYPMINLDRWDTIDYLLSDPYFMVPY